MVSITEQSLPLIYTADSATDIAYWNNQWISRSLFLSQVMALSSCLPKHRYIINLCQDRYHFMVAFAASIVAGRVSLLPSNQSAGEIEKLANEYTDSIILSEQLELATLKPDFIFNINKLVLDKKRFTVPNVSAQQLVAMVFTSGSTGQAKPNKKYWGGLSVGTECLAQRFDFGMETGRSVVSTVVPQHMFGLETSVLLPMLSNTCIYADRPFYPADISQALSEIHQPAVLVTTPVHLKACANSSIEWPEFEFILSATAPLSQQLAGQVEDKMGVVVKEIFGCTEAGSFASRATLNDNDWRLYDGFSFRREGDLIVLQAPHLTEVVVLSDVIEEHSEGRFRVLGRSTDMVKIAGKRASLADLNHKLNQIDKVQEGVFFVPKILPDQEEVARLCAFVVAPNMSEADIQAKLSTVIDSVFLPRPLIKLDRLPYNEIGKLPRDSLQEQFERHRSRQLV